MAGKAIETAARKLANIFERNAFFGPPRRLNSEHHETSSRQQTADTATQTLEIISLLEEMPLLASKRYECCARSYPSNSYDYIVRPNDQDDESFNPLVFFLWNNFGIKFLEKIFALNPDAVAAKQGRYPSLLHLACSFSCVSDETLHWILSKCDRELLGVRDTIEPGLTPLYRLLCTKEHSDTFLSQSLLFAFLRKSTTFTNDGDRRLFDSAS